MNEFLKVHDILEYLDLNDSMAAAEFGCGSAAFALALAKKLKKGKVYALDIQEEKLSALKGKMSIEKLNNIVAILGDLEEKNGSTLPNEALDAVLIPNVLFQAENKHGMLEEAKRILKKGGQLLVVDWLKKTSFSPKGLPAQAGGMVTPDEVKKMAESLGLLLKKEFAAGDYHYALLFIK